MAVETMFQGQRMLLVHIYDNYVDANLAKSKVVDLSTFTMALGDTCARVSIEQIDFNVQGGNVTLEWDRTTDQNIGTFTGFNRRLWTVPKKDGGTGETGDILLTTDCLGGSYDIELTLIMHKN
jgi:hypothetical protein